MEKSFDPDAIRERFRRADDPGQWRSLEELVKTKDFREWMKYEFPAGADQWVESVNRRGFLKLMAASLGLAGLTACVRQPQEKIVPYVKQPEGMIPGRPLHYASAAVHDGYANGVIVTSHEGRPTKIEGNPDHPASLGATDIFAQASVLDLYDPDRSQAIKKSGQLADYAAFVAELGGTMSAMQATQGEGLHLLTGTVTSPSLADLIGQLLSSYPKMVWHQYQPVSRDNLLEGARMAFKQPVATLIDFSKADVILSLDSDFLTEGPERVRYARAFADRRKVREGQKNDMNRLYVAEPSPTLTGTMADHRLPLQAMWIDALARAVGKDLGLQVQVPDGLSPRARQWAAVVASDLKSADGRAVVTAGRAQPAEVHALVHAMNAALGAVGQTITYTAPVEAAPDNQWKSMTDLVSAMNSGDVDTLVVLGPNPLYDTPAHLGFSEAFSKVRFKVHLGLFEDETAAASDWHIPAAHTLESWGDARAFDGTISIIQPLIEPLYGGKSVHEVLAAMLGQTDKTDHDLVQAYWKQHVPEGKAFEAFWRQTLHDGLISGTASSSIDVNLTDSLGGAPASVSPPKASGMEVVFRPDPNVWDGAAANNGWLQELPKPLTKLTWDNVVWLAPSTAESLGLDNEHVVRLQYQGRLIEAPVWVTPGQAPNTATIFLGYGRRQSGRVGQFIGYDAYQLRRQDSPWFGQGLQITPTGGRYALASTQLHHAMEGRDLVKVDDVAAFNAGQISPEELQTDKPSLYNAFTYKDYAWGMSIDLSACVGCNACIVACVAENNAPTVGKEQVRNGREMQWLRVDSYFAGNPDEPEIYHQAVPCMQCENAPCEVVCPVGATLHSEEGLNDMVYNRCIGTRYCSNNCPYKVRHFNFLQFQDENTPSLKLMRNPEVTVRSRGVMEKCTYCIQRITEARITSQEEGRQVLDGEIQTACQQACPTQAIVFGDINTKGSRVAGLKNQPHNYSLLAELNTRPRTTYLYKFRNPNPDMVKLEQAA